MKKYISLVGFLLIVSFTAQAMPVVCNNSDTQFIWTQAEIKPIAEREISFTILRGNTDIGKTAVLSQNGTVHPNGRTFFHYHGQFEPGASQRSISFYLSEDSKTLTLFLRGGSQNWSCE